MARLALISALFLFFLASALSTEYKDIFNEKLISKINSDETSTWTAGINQNFAGATAEEVKRLLGWKPDPSKRPQLTVDRVAQSIPDSFDSRTTWPNCTSIGAIQNQARCGSCWAFGCVEAVTDRFCIHAAGNWTDIQLSFQDIVTCDMNDMGCEGGEAGSAWAYVHNNGLVSAACSPYTVPTCPPQQQPCLNFVPTPPCKKECVNGQTWDQTKHFVGQFYGVSEKVSAIQTEIMTNGPVEACFTVYEDFVSYKSGVYIHKSGPALGGHCVKIIGWGVLNNVPYWTVANSWTTYWGDQGFFLILRGHDECGIESDVVAGMPDYQRSGYF